MPALELPREWRLCGSGRSRFDIVDFAPRLSRSRCCRLCSRVSLEAVNNATGERQLGAAGGDVIFVARRLVRVGIKLHGLLGRDNHG